MKIEGGTKWLIKNIEVQGVTMISQEEIKTAVSPYENQWLTKEDINMAIELIKATYMKNGFNDKPAKITFKVRKRTLLLNVEE